VRIRKDLRGKRSGRKEGGGRVCRVEREGERKKMEK